MAINLEIGGGKTVQVEAPVRTQFTDNLGGAVQFALALALYQSLAVMGNSLGTFFAGFFVKFMERLEPELVHYAAPLLDLILKQPDLDPDLRKFFEQLQAPTHFAAAGILGGLASSAGGQVMSSVVQILTSPWIRSLNRSGTPSRAGPSEAWAMAFRGDIGTQAAENNLADQGWPPYLIKAFKALARAKLSPSDLLAAASRVFMSWTDAKAAMQLYGFTPEECTVLYNLTRTRAAAGDYLASWLRGDMSEGILDIHLGNLGYPVEEKPMLKQLARWIPGAQDLIRMGVREAWDDKIASQFGYDADFPAQFGEWLTKSGGSADWAKKYWRAHWNLPSVTQGYEMMHRNIISPTTLETLLRVADYPTYWRDAMMKVSYNPLTRVDVRRMYGLGVLKRADVKRSYLDLGYDNTNAERMTEFTVRYEDRLGESTPEKYRELTQAQIIRAYGRGLYNRQEAYNQLIELRYYPEDIEFLLNMSDFDKSITAIPDFSSEYQRDVKSMVEKAYGTSLIDKSAAATMLKDIGLGDSDVDYTIAAVDYGVDQADKDTALDAIAKAYNVRAITKTDAVVMIGKLNIPASQQERLFRIWDLDRDIRNRRLTEAQYRKAMTDKLITQTEYEENLRGLGYTESDIKLLVALYPAAE